MTTPQTKTDNLAKKLNLSANLFLKREDLHPLKSHKGRSLPIMIDQYLKNNQTNFVISSSGNAALAAAFYIKKYNQNNNDKKITLKIFVGKNINTNKLSDLKSLLDDNITITQIANPKQAAFQKSKNEHFQLLRQSTDDAALIGYETLAKELIKIKNLQAVFIPTSSGTTAYGLHLAFKKLGVNPQIHIIQTTACHPMVKNFTGKKTKTSLAGAIVDNVAHRKNEIFLTLKNSNGHAWVANDEKIKEIIKIVKETEKIEISPNSALALVGIQQATKQKWPLKGSVVALITGK